MRDDRPVISRSQELCVNPDHTGYEYIFSFVQDIVYDSLYGIIVMGMN